MLEMLPKTKKKKALQTPKAQSYQGFFLARCKGYSRLRRLACSATAAAQQYPPHTSRLKTVPRTVFIGKADRPCSNPFIYFYQCKKQALRPAFRFGGEQGIRTLEQALTCYTISKSSNGYFSRYLVLLIPILENKSIIL